MGGSRSGVGGRLNPSSLWESEGLGTHPGRTSTALREGPQPLKASWDPVASSGRSSNRPRPARSQKRRSALGWFVHHYGWRAYAIPVLVALTVLVIFRVVQDNRHVVVAAAGTSSTGAVVPQAGSSAGTQTTVTVTNAGTVTTIQAPATGSAGVGAGVGNPAQLTPTSPSAAAPTLTSNTTTGYSAPDPNSGAFQNVSGGDLPPGGAFTATGKGTWHLVPGTTAPIGTGPHKFTYTVTVEDGLESTSADQEFASAVVATLQDPRSWMGSGNYTFQRISSGTPSFTISLTSQMTERQDSLCGWEIHMEASCYARDQKRVSINDARWTRGAVSYNGDLQLYRIYAINHEVGHALGFMHQPCKIDGGMAPVMMQQSWSVVNNDLAPLSGGLVPDDGKVCKPNPYPFPRGPESSGNSDSPDNPGAGTVGAAITTKTTGR